MNENDSWLFCIRRCLRQKQASRDRDRFSFLLRLEEVVVGKGHGLKRNDLLSRELRMRRRREKHHAGKEAGTLKCIFMSSSLDFPCTPDESGQAAASSACRAIARAYASVPKNGGDPPVEADVAISTEQSPRRHRGFR